MLSFLKLASLTKRDERSNTVSLRIDTFHNPHSTFPAQSFFSWSDKWKPAFQGSLAEQVKPTCNASSLFSESTRFESPPGTQKSWQAFCGFSQSLQVNGKIVPRAGGTYNSLQFIIHLLPYPTLQPQMLTASLNKSYEYIGRLQTCNPYSSAQYARVCSLYLDTLKNNNKISGT